MKAVIHVDEMEKWEMALGNLKRLIAHCQDADEPCALELVANGEAAPALTVEAAGRLGLRPALDTVLTMGAAVCVCQGALRGSGIDPAALVPGLMVIPSGVVELVQRQGEGYAYVKP